MSQFAETSRRRLLVVSYVAVIISATRLSLLCCQFVNNFLDCP
ncbi:unnamed protein product [Ixodes pacificus]